MQLRSCDPWALMSIFRAAGRLLGKVSMRSRINPRAAAHLPRRIPVRQGAGFPGVEAPF